MECKSPDFSSALRNALCAVPSSPEQNRKKRDTSSNSEFIFYIGFGFDGHDNYQNISTIPELQQYARLFVTPDPEINRFKEGDDIKRLQELEVQVEIDGENLQSGKI